MRSALPDPRPLVFLVPGSLETRTGGSIYDSRMVDLLRHRGRLVRVIELESPDAAGAALAGLTDQAVTLVDGLIFSAIPDVVERAVVMVRGDAIDAGDLIFGPSYGESKLVTAPLSGTASILANRQIADIEREAILATLECTGGNKTEAARRLGVTARTLSNKMKIWRRAGLVA